jgi:hypothetical protein
MAWAPLYATPAELESWIQVGSVSTFEMINAVETASRSVDRITNRQFGLVDAPEDRYYTAFYDRKLCRWVIEIDDLMTVTGLVITAASTEGVYDQVITAHRLEPANAAANGRPWTHIVVANTSAVSPTKLHDGVKVTAKYGWSAVPHAVKQATLIQAARLFARRHAPFGLVGNPEVGEMRLLEKLDVDLVTSVKPFQRIWGAV